MNMYWANTPSRGCARFVDLSAVFEAAESQTRRSRCPPAAYARRAEPGRPLRRPPRCQQTDTGRDALAVCLYSMRVRVSLRRETGKPRPPFGQRAAATGDLHLSQLTVHGRRVDSLQLLGADRECPRLFEPRLVALSTNVLRFIGFERAGDAWVMQEWECELL